MGGLLHVYICRDDLGRVEIELADEILPMTCENFRLLCQGVTVSGRQTRWEEEPGWLCVLGLLEGAGIILASVAVVIGY